MAVRVDANDQLFMLAFSVVEGEKNENWGGFMACIWARVMQRPDLCIILGRHRGILVVMNDDYLEWGLRHEHHRFYVQHLASNFHFKFNDKTLKMFLIRAA